MIKLTRRSALIGGVSSLAAPFLRTASAQTQNLRIGVISQISGYAQIFGGSIKAGAEIAAERLNRSGGVNGQQVEIVTRDDKSTAEGAVAGYRDLSTNGIKFYIGGPISSSALALVPLFDKADALFMAAGSGNLSITHESYNENIFRLQFTTPTVYTGLAQLVAKKNPTVRKWVAISSDQQVMLDGSKVLTNGIKKYYKEEHGADVQFAEPFVTKAGAGDFRNQLTQIANMDVEGLVSCLVGTDAITFFKQARAFGLDKKIKVYVDVVMEMQLVGALGSNVPANVWTQTPWYHAADPSNTVSRDLYQALQARDSNNKFPFGYTAYGHDSVLAFAEAVRAAKSTDVPAVRAAMEAGSPMGAAGPIKFRKEDHNYLSEMVFINFGSDAKEKDGWKVFEVEKLDSALFMEPATPGKKFDL
jgi:branched-chain amino acid transport system substrate-binding protein